MPDGEEPVAEPTLESLNADMRAQSSLLRELATAMAQLTARDRVVDGEGAHGSGSGQRFAGQPTGSGGAAERPDLLELAQSGRVGAKSVSAEDDYLARLQLQVAGVGEGVAAGVDVAAKDAFGSDELGQRTLDLLSSSLSAQTLKSYAGRLSQFAEFCHDSENTSPLEATTATVVRYVAWIGERGHIAAKSLQPYLSAINTFFELHNLVPIAKDSLHLTSARRGLMLRQRRLDAASLRVPLPADVAYRFVSKAELIVSAPYPKYHLDFRALLASVANFMFFARGLTSVSCRVRDVHVDTYNITLQVYREKGRAGRRGPDDLRVLLLPVSEHPRVARLLHHFIDNVQSVPLRHIDCSPLHPVIPALLASLSTDSYLVVDDRSAPLRSEDGVQQGAPLATTSFCVAIHPEVQQCDTTLEGNDGAARFNADDGILVGLPEHVWPALHAFRTSIKASVGLEVRFDKMQAYNADMEAARREAPADIEWPELDGHHGIAVLNVPLGSPEYV
eukprot:jgi/Tetstr1/441108/TSEL_029376.t1